MPEIDEMSWWQAAEAVDEVFLRGRAACGGQLALGLDPDTGKVSPAVRIAPVRNLITLALFEATRSANGDGDGVDVDQAALTSLGGLLTPESARSLIIDSPLPEHIYAEERTELLDGVQDTEHGLYRSWAQVAKVLVMDHIGAFPEQESEASGVRFSQVRAALTARQYTVPDRSVGYGGHDAPGDTRALKERGDEACRRRVRRAVLRWRASGGPQAWLASIELAHDALIDVLPTMWGGQTYTEMPEASVAALALGLYLSAVEQGVEPAQVERDAVRAEGAGWHAPLDDWYARATAVGHDVNDPDDQVVALLEFLAFDYREPDAWVDPIAAKLYDEDSTCLSGTRMEQGLGAVMSEWMRDRVWHEGRLAVVAAGR